MKGGVRKEDVRKESTGIESITRKENTRKDITRKDNPTNTIKSKRTLNPQTCAFQGSPPRPSESFHSDQKQ